MFGYHFLAQVAITGRVLRAPCSQRLVEEAGKGLDLGITAGKLVTQNGNRMFEFRNRSVTGVWN